MRRLILILIAISLVLVPVASTTAARKLFVP